MTTIKENDRVDVHVTREDGSTHTIRAAKIEKIESSGLVHVHLGHCRIRWRDGVATWPTGVPLAATLEPTTGWWA